MNTSILPPLLLPLIAVGLGFGIALIFKPAVSNNVKLLLSFSGAFLLAITVFEFLPEIYKQPNKYVGPFIMIGLLIQILLEFGSKGAEHGHIHQKSDTRFPLLLFISLGSHSFIEGFPIVDNQELLYGVVIHKIPIAIIISAFLLNAQLSKLHVFLFLLGFSMMTPLGAFAKAYLPILQSYSLYVNAFAVGILLHVATTILFESSKNHQFNASKFAAIVTGIVLAYFL